VTFQEIGPRTKNIAGQRFGRLVAVEPVGKDKRRRHVIWRFVCDCGGELRSAWRRSNCGRRAAFPCVDASLRRRECRERAAGASGLVPHALVRLLRAEDRLAVVEGDTPSRIASGSSPASARTSARKDSMRWSIRLPRYAGWEPRSCVSRGRSRCVAGSKRAKPPGTVSTRAGLKRRRWIQATWRCSPRCATPRCGLVAGTQRVD
jgi:hypothetical protein